MNRFSEAFLVTVLGLACVTGCLWCLLIKPFGFCRRQTYADLFDDLRGSCTMVRCGFMHPFVPMF